MKDQAAQDAATMKRVGLVVAGLAALMFVLIAAALIIT